MRPGGPRLLVAARARDDLRSTVGARLPKVGWAFRSELASAEWGSVEAMLVGSARRELAEVDFATMPRLRFVQQLYTGVDGFPFERLPASVRVAGNVGGYAPFVAEHAVALAMAAARDLPRSFSMVREGKLRPAPVHRLIHGRVAAVLGYGEIGRGIAQRMTGLGAEIVGVNRSGRMAPGVARMYPADRLREALAGAEFVFEARPLTRTTARSIARAELEAMSPTGVFVNVGRAGTVDEAELFAHLQSHPEFRAALDVWWGERFDDARLEEPFPFAALPNLLGSPHCAAAGPGVESYALDRALDNLVRFFSGEEPRFVVDRTEYEPSVPAARDPGRPDGTTSTPGPAPNP